MNQKVRYIIFILLDLLLSIIAEKVISHSHIEYNGKVIPDWDNHEKAPPQDENEEMLHSSFYLLSSLESSLEKHIIDKNNHSDSNPKNLIDSLNVADYYFIPKILNNILFIVHTYSSKSPPLYY